MTSDKVHLAIIPDGNRRWAKNHSLLPWKGHEKAVRVFSNVTDWALKRGNISVVTIWCFSTENWKRDPKEIDELMKLLHNYLVDERTKLREQHIHLIRSGRNDRIPKSLLQLIDDISEETKENPKMTLHLALDYGGKDEVVRALQKRDDELRRGGDEEPVTEDIIARYLDHPELPPIDLIIRTSGEQRTSNFFLWQSAYAEWKFFQKHFPEITEDDLEAAMKDFESRSRRFGA